VFVVCGIGLAKGNKKAASLLETAFFEVVIKEFY